MEEALNKLLKVLSEGENLFLLDLLIEEACSALHVSCSEDKRLLAFRSVTSYVSTWALHCRLSALSL